MTQVERNVDFLLGMVNGDISLHIGRGYLKENGKYKQTLSVPVDPYSASDVLYDQLLRFDCLYAIDTNNVMIKDSYVSVSCALHLSLEYGGNNQWRNATYTRLPAVISIPGNEKPEVVAWRRLIEALSPKVDGMLGVVVDSELGNLPLYNARALPISSNYMLPENTQLIYASSERDMSSPLNKAMMICDKDANKIISIIKETVDHNVLLEKLKNSQLGCIFIEPSFS